MTIACNNMHLVSFALLFYSAGVHACMPTGYIVSPTPSDPSMYGPTAKPVTKDDAQKLMDRLGYSENNPNVNVKQSNPFGTDGSSASNVVAFIKLYQQNYGLPITGVLDNTTLLHMAQPRCGSPEIFKLQDIQRGMAERYAFNGGKWSRTSLTYQIQIPSDEGLTASQISTSIKAAFDMWSAVTPLQFTYISETQPKADIVLGWRHGVHEDGAMNAFDGPGHILAHAFQPEYGILHFDGDESWTTNSMGFSINLEQVATHEIGHALGLSHTNNTNAVMYPVYSLQRFSFSLGSDDIRGIQKLYGGGTGSGCSMRPLLTSTTCIVIFNLIRNIFDS